MSLASRLYSLQVTDTQLRDTQRTLKDITRRLEHNEELAAAEAALSRKEEELEAARKAQRTLEYEVDDLSAKIKDVSERLYGGGVKNTKELMGLEQDLQSLKRRRSKQEELLIDAMDTTERLEASAQSAREETEGLRAAWKKEAAELTGARDAARDEIARLQQLRSASRQEIDPATVSLYDDLVKSKAVAVVKVEGGRCKGCNLTVPTGQWQRARFGDVVQCPSCSRIIYVD
ncbi:MAG: zinc ribbon domain-containing protein [Chloroflexota bacterium]